MFYLLYLIDYKLERKIFIRIYSYKFINLLIKLLELIEERYYNSYKNYRKSRNLKS